MFYNNSHFDNLTALNVLKVLKTYDDLLNTDLSKIERTPGGIPKLIFKTSWQTIDKFPKEMEDALEHTIVLNPKYQVYYFDDRDVHIFMKNFGPSEYAAYTKLIPGAFKADLFRYCVLYTYGGIYSDIGHIVRKPFDSIIGDSKLVLVKDKPHNTYTGIHNALICVTKENLFMKALIDQVVENVKNNYYGTHGLEVTGPIMMGKVFQCYYSNICNKELNEKYLTEKDNIKIYELHKKHLNPTYTHYVIESGNNVIIDTKFKNYYKIMYPPTKTKRYEDLWKEKAIYKKN
jgi:mannosyltransferase OCH1-like enzyme